jgi:hypothetical protein
MKGVPSVTGGPICVAGGAGEAAAAVHICPLCPPIVEPEGPQDQR